MINLLFLIGVISVATTAVLFKNADAKAELSKTLIKEAFADLLKSLLARNRRKLVRSRAKEHITNNTKVISPGFIALLKNSSVVINDKPIHATTEKPKTFCGIR